MKNKILSIVKIILVIILVTSLYKIYSYNKADKEFKTATREVQEKFQEPNEEKLANDNKDKEAREKIEALQKDYESVIGWIKVEVTEIDYPIVKGSDNNYYLNHNYKDEYNVFGAIFMDYRNMENFSDQNTIIYGHNNARAGNFKDLHKYEEEGFFTEDRFIEIYSLEGYKKYKVFAAYNAGPHDNFRNTSYLDEEGAKFLEYVKERSIVKGEVPDKVRDFLTLQTCSPKDTRFVVHGVLVND